MQLELKNMQYNLETHRGRIPASVSFDPDIMMRLEALRGRVSRSRYINRALNVVMTKEEEKLERMEANAGAT